MNNLEITLNGKTHVIEVREKDGYLNATQLCKVGDKRFNDYMNNQSSKGYHKYLESTTRNLVVDLIQIQNGGSSPGTWVHKKVAYHIAAWISPVFMDQLIELYDRMVTGDLTLVRDVVRNHDAVNNTQSTVLIQTQELDILERRERLNELQLKNKEREVALEKQKVLNKIEIEAKLDTLDTTGVQSYKESINILKSISSGGELTDTDKRFYKDLIKNNNARRSTLLALESKEAYDARKERFLLPVSDLYKQITGRAGNTKIWMALGKELAAGYRSKHDGKEPLKTESHVNGVTRMIKAAYGLGRRPHII